MRVDLHLHSTASDGALTPAEVVQAALKHRLDAIALTDHDTVEASYLLSKRRKARPCA